MIEPEDKISFKPSSWASGETLYGRCREGHQFVKGSFRARLAEAEIAHRALQPGSVINISEDELQTAEWCLHCPMVRTKALGSFEVLEQLHLSGGLLLSNDVR